MPTFVMTVHRSIVRTMASFRQEHIHTVVKMTPQSYAYTHNCHHNVLRLYEPTYRTVLTQAELTAFKSKLRKQYGRDIRIRHWWRCRHQRITVAYAPERFQGENLRQELEEVIYCLLFDSCLRSHTVLLEAGRSRC